GLAVGDHHDLLVGVATPQENLLREAQPGLRVRVEGPYSHIGKLFQGHERSVVAEQDDAQLVLRIARRDQLGEGQGHSLGRREAAGWWRTPKVAPPRNPRGPLRAPRDRRARRGGSRFRAWRASRSR